MTAPVGASRTPAADTEEAVTGGATGASGGMDNSGALAEDGKGPDDGRCRVHRCRMATSACTSLLRRLAVGSSASAAATSSELLSSADDHGSSTRGSSGGTHAWLATGGPATGLGSTKMGPGPPPAPSPSSSDVTGEVPRTAAAGAVTTAASTPTTGPVKGGGGGDPGGPAVDDSGRSAPSPDGRRGGGPAVEVVATATVDHGHDRRHPAPRAAAGARGAHRRMAGQRARCLRRRGPRATAPSGVGASTSGDAGEKTKRNGASRLSAANAAAAAAAAADTVTAARVGGRAGQGGGSGDGDTGPLSRPPSAHDDGATGRPTTVGTGAWPRIGTQPAGGTAKVEGTPPAGPRVMVAHCRPDTNQQDVQDGSSDADEAPVKEWTASNSCDGKGENVKDGPSFH